MNFNESDSYTVWVTCANTEWNMQINIETAAWGIQAFIFYVLILMFISAGMQLLIIQVMEELVNANTIGIWDYSLLFVSAEISHYTV